MKLVLLFLLFFSILVIFSYMLYRIWLDNQERKRIKEWEDKVNGDTVYIFQDCLYRGPMISEKITDPMSSMYDSEDGFRSMIIPEGAEIDGYVDEDKTIKFTYKGPQVLRCITDTHDLINYIHITHS